MCGLAGFLNFNDNEALANASCRAQAHRGPDSQHVWSHENLTFSHQRLSIIDLSTRSDQPLVKNGLAIIFNGEIYNYQELRDSLLKEYENIQFETTGDTEVILELYRHKKEHCLDDLVGMFAFSIFEMETGRLFIARDHFGIKPIFYTQIGNAFAFSSELKTLITLPDFNKNLNFDTVVSAINYLWVPGNDTMFQECHKLPPAHYMTIDTTANLPEPILVRYWSLNTAITHSEEGTTVEFLRKTVEESIRRHMIADVPVSTFLSGGLDSSLISAIASRDTPNLSSYTISTTDEDKKIEQMPEDEKYAFLVAKQFGLDHHEIVIRPDIINELHNIVHALDEPIGDPAAINTLLICRAARQRGVKVLLSGMGADEIFFGYRRHKATLLGIRYRKLPKFVRNAISVAISAVPVKFMGKGVKFSRWGKRFLSFANLSVEESYMRSYSYYDRDELSRLFQQDISDSYAKLRKHHATLFESAYQGDQVNQICHTDISMFMLGLNLTYTDRASMAASVEVRVPFIDRLLIQAAMNISGDLKYRNGQSKYILKKVAEKYLPKEVIYRPKASFGVPLRSWVSKDLRPLVDDLLSKENIEKRGIFKSEYIKKMVDNDRRGLEDNAYKIYQLLTFEIWCRKFVD